MRGLAHTLRIRHLRLDEVDELKELVYEAFSGRDACWALRDLWYTEVLVAEWRGKLVGFLEYYLAIFRGALAGAIYYLGVGKGYRRRGIATRLVATAEGVFRGRGAKYSMASTKSSNIASRNLFRKMGYVEVGDPEVVRELKRILYAYEDDVFFLKPL